MASQPPKFEKGFLGANVVLPPKARSLTPTLGNTTTHHLRSLESANHLEQALDLAIGIAQRYTAEKRSFTAAEQQKMVQLGGFSKSAGAAFTVPAPTEGSRRASLEALPQSQSGDRVATPSTPSSRMSNLFGKLKQVTQATHVYKEMTVSKSNMSVLANISIRCAEAGDDYAAVANVIKGALHAQEPPINATTYIIDAVGESFVDPLTSDRVSKLATDHPIARAQKERSIYRKDEDLYMPLVSNDVTVGVIYIDAKSSQVDESREDFLKSLMSTVTICIKNVTLMASVRWQVEKAEAMLMMANQLSRDNLDEQVLVQSIMQTAKSLTESDRCSIFLVNGANLQAYFEDGKSVTMSIDSGIAGHVAKSGETVNIREAYEDARFNSAVDKATGYRTKTILCMPVHYEGSIVAVAQLINKKPKAGKAGDIERVFSKRDEELFMTFSTFAGVSLRNCRINANLLVEKKKSEAVLDVVQMLSDTDIRDVNQIVSHVMLGAKKLLNADRSSLFLIDKERDELYSKVADSTGGKEIRFKSGKGIAGTVASSGIAENIHDAYEDERFNRDVDKAFNYRTRSILCEPITCKGDVLAVAQLVNRLDPDTEEVITFTPEDQMTFRTFAMFAGISISNSHLLEFAVNAGKEAMALNERRNDQALGQRRPSSGNITIRPVLEEEKAPIRNVELSSTESVTSKNFDFFEIRENAEHALNSAVAVAMKVISNTGLPEKFKCPEDVLLTFICQCRRRYRHVPYHNFFHAVDACQTVSTFLYEGGVAQLLTELECFVLLITALVHDLDHMGLNNSFHLKTDSPLGILSSASGNNSVLEVHHCNLAIEILEDPKSNVFIGLEPAEAKVAYRGLIDCVLATDMAKHGDLSKHFDEIKLNTEDENDRRAIMEMVMKAADISNVTKPFPVSKKWAMAVTEEFYQQGDKEKERGVDVLPMFDRSAKQELAKGQLGFIDFIASKFFGIIAKQLPGLQWTVDNINSNKVQWTRTLEARRASMLAEEDDAKKAAEAREQRSLNLSAGSAGARQSLTVE